ncbi:MAG: 3'-5' exonuclease [Cytophagales bacterium]|nr:exodeoxyribonuclease V subunit gamma [Bernardetiaceae bacterium]MDW8209559.1 3'-5' exonuclease [Cytophagales bacterium]
MEEHLSLANYLSSLNEPQRQAVLHQQGPLMIIAGAGSGKTRALTYRIAYLIQQGVDPFNILALTFTNKAAREMRQRIEQILGGSVQRLWMGTFHSIFARILRTEASLLGYTSEFTIYDTEDSKSLLKSVIHEMELDDRIYKVNTVFARISAAKNRLISWQSYLSNPSFLKEDEESAKPKLGEIYKNYVQRCFKANAMDFDDLLFNVNVLFRDHPEVLKKYQTRFEHLLIDEFQDTNLAQYLATRSLAALHQNICVVGDDAQSIYAFRGADIRNILNFAKDYPQATVIRLEQNYRSTKRIVAVANKVIAHNKYQLPKTVWTANEEGEPIEIIRAATDIDEGRLIASSIFELKMRYQAHNRDFAVLYRTHAQSRVFEEALRRLNINYRVYGGLSFYQRKEIKDLIAYFRFTINQQDEEAFRRIVNLPRRGIGESTVQKILLAAAENNVSIGEVIAQPEYFLGKSRINAAITDFAEMIKDFAKVMQQKNAYETALYIAKNSGLLRELYEDKTIEGRVRYENVHELLNAIKEFVDDSQQEDKSLAAFLHQVALLTSTDENDKENTDVVSLMTIHQAKGLEFNFVYIVGMEEGIFPSSMISTQAEMEEERRLFYVAITRAAKRLTISYALQRYRYGELEPSEPSSFLEEIDYRHVRMGRVNQVGFIDKQRLVQHPTVESDSPKLLSKDFAEKTNVPKNLISPPTSVYIHKPSAHFVASDLSKLKEGMRVEHLRFGFGTVVSVDLKSSERRAVIHFDQVGEKTLLLNFAKLMIIE